MLLLETILGAIPIVDDRGVVPASEAERRLQMAHPKPVGNAADFAEKRKNSKRNVVHTPDALKMGFANRVGQPVTLYFMHARGGEIEKETVPIDRSSLKIRTYAAHRFAVRTTEGSILINTYLIGK